MPRLKSAKKSLTKKRGRPTAKKILGKKKRKVGRPRKVVARRKTKTTSK